MATDVRLDSPAAQLTRLVPGPYDGPRPRTWGDCLARGLGTAEAPCPFATCHHSLLVRVSGLGRADGGVQLLPAGLALTAEGDDVPALPTCALRVADEGATLEDVGAILGLTRERIRQIEAHALAHANRRAPRHLAVYLEDDRVPWRTLGASDDTPEGGAYLSKREANAGAARVLAKTPAQAQPAPVVRLAPSERPASVPVPRVNQRAVAAALDADLARRLGTPAISESVRDVTSCFLEGEPNPPSRNQGVIAARVPAEPSPLPSAPVALGPPVVRCRRGAPSTPAMRGLIESAVAALGSVNAVAAALGVAAPNVSTWRRGREGLPAARQAQLERLLAGAPRPTPTDPETPAADAASTEEEMPMAEPTTTTTCAHPGCTQAADPYTRRGGREDPEASARCKVHRMQLWQQRYRDRKSSAHGKTPRARSAQARAAAPTVPAAQAQSPAVALATAYQALRAANVDAAAVGDALAAAVLAQRDT